MMEGEQVIIVTGAAGLIGSCVVAELNRRGLDDLILVDHIDTSDNNGSVYKKCNIENKKYVKYYEKSKFIKLIEDNNIEEKITSLIKNNSKIKSARKTLGNWDMLFSIVAESQKEIHDSVKEIKKILLGSMKNYSNWLAYEEPYFTTFPEILMKIGNLRLQTVSYTRKLNVMTPIGVC